MPVSAWIAALALLAAGDGERDLARIARLAPAEQCVALETLLKERDLEAATRATALARIRDLATVAAPPLSEAERAVIADLAARSGTVAEPLLSRTTILLGNPTFVSNARAGLVPGILDAAYVVQRELFGTDPVRDAGRRYVVHPDASKASGWSIQNATLVVSYGRAQADQGGFDPLLLHEISHGFTARIPARHLLGGGFGEGWSDLAIAYTAERLASFGEPLAGTWADWRDGILSAGEIEHVRTRLPAEEIVAYGPSVSMVLRLVLDAPRAGDADPWAPVAALFRDAGAAPYVATPWHLWTTRFALDLQRAFPGDATIDALSRWRFPLDARGRKEVELHLADARRATPPTRAERWARAGETPIRAWRVLGPVPVPTGRFASCDFDPLDAWNFAERDAIEVAGTRHAWHGDARVDEHGVAHLGDLPGGDAAHVTYLRADLPPEAAGPLTLSIASDDDCLVWIDGVLVHSFRGNRGTDPDDPDRAYALVAPGGGRVLAQVASRGGGAGFHLRWSKGTPFETSLRTEARAPDARRRLAAARRFGTLRVPYDLVAPLYDAALHDASPAVRAEAAWFLGARRNEPRAIEELLAAWEREKDPAAAQSLRAAIGELALQDFADSAAAHRWWRDSALAWKSQDHVEAELAYALQSAHGGFYGNDERSHGRQHVGRCFGGDRGHGLSLVLEARETSPYSLFVRYAAADGERRADVRLRRGESPIALRAGAVFAKTADGSAWTWQEIPLGVLPAGRVRVEISNVDGCLDLDTLGLRPTRP